MTAVDSNPVLHEVAFKLKLRKRVKLTLTATDQAGNRRSVKKTVKPRKR